MKNLKKIPIFFERDYPILFQINQEFKNHHRFSSNIISNGVSHFGDQWLIEFERIANALLKNKEEVAAAARGYALFAMNSMRLQAEFESTKAYRNKTYEQASSEVYNNEKYMMEEYLPGLLLSHFLWPHHYRQLQFFNSSFLSEIQLIRNLYFIEVGIGTGLYSALLLQSKSNAHGTGIDISPFSLKFAKNLLTELGVTNRYDFELRDINANDTLEAKANRLICVEVLEHLEDPVSFLRSLRRYLAPGGKAFITAAINAAHSDHIYLYRNNKEVCDHLHAAGFIIEQSYAGKAYQAVTPEIPIPEAAAFIVH